MRGQPLRTRSPQLLTALLKRGFFVCGNQRITKASLPWERHPTYCLWEHWGLLRYRQASASSLSDLLTITGVRIEEWSFVLNTQDEEQKLEDLFTL